jgi:hypothetical protein
VGNNNKKVKIIKSKKEYWNNCCIIPSGCNSRKCELSVLISDSLGMGCEEGEMKVSKRHKEVFEVALVMASQLYSHAQTYENVYFACKILCMDIISQ